MFEGRDLMEYFRLQHLLKDKGISITEYNAMLPWTLDVEISLMRLDQEQAKRSNSSHVT